MKKSIYILIFIILSTIGIAKELNEIYIDKEVILYDGIYKSKTIGNNLLEIEQNNIKTIELNSSSKIIFISEKEFIWNESSISTHTCVDGCIINGWMVLNNNPIRTGKETWNTYEVMYYGIDYTPKDLKGVYNESLLTLTPFLIEYNEVVQINDELSKEKNYNLNLTTYKTAVTIETFGAVDPTTIIYYTDLSKGYYNGTVYGNNTIGIKEIDNATIINSALLYFDWDNTVFTPKINPNSITWTSSTADSPINTPSGIVQSSGQKIINLGGVDDYIESNISIFMKLYANNYYDNMKIFRQQNFISYDISGTNLRFYVWGQSAGNCLTYAVSNLPVGRWYNMVITKNNATSEAKLYVDGNLVKTETCTRGTFQSSSSVAAIGSDNGNNIFNGTLNSFGIWDTVLSDNDILELNKSAQFHTTSEYYTEINTLNQTGYNMINVTSIVDCDGLDCPEVSVRYKSFIDTTNMTVFSDFDGDNNNAFSNIASGSSYSKTNTPIIVEGKDLRGVHFDGSSTRYDRINFNYPNKNYENHTLCFNFKTNEPAGRGFVLIDLKDVIRITMSNHDPRRLQVTFYTSAGQFNFNGFGTGAMTYANDKWHFLCHMKNGTEVAAYVNGVKEQRNTAVTGNMTASSATFNVGATWNNLGGANATIDNIIYFERALSYDELLELNNTVNQWIETSSQSTTDGTSQLNFSINNQSRYYQIKGSMYADGSANNKIYNISSFAYTYTREEGEPPGNDSCIYPGSGDWVFTDNCILTVPTDIGANNLIVRSPYWIDIRTIIKAKAYYIEQPNAKIYGYPKLE